MRSEGLLERELHFCLCIKKYSAGGQLGENGRIIGGGVSPFCITTDSNNSFEIYLFIFFSSFRSASSSSSGASCCCCVNTDVCGDQQRQRHLPVQRDGRHVAPVSVQSHPAGGHLRPGPPALLLLHHSDHPHQLHPHDHAAQRLHRIHRVSPHYPPPHLLLSNCLLPLKINLMAALPPIMIYDDQSLRVHTQFLLFSDGPITSPWFGQNNQMFCRRQHTITQYGKKRREIFHLPS